MSIVSKIKELRSKYPEYAYMQYKVDDKKNYGENWLIAELGLSPTDEGIIITTDRVHCSEMVGNAKSDAELIVALLNMFCNEKEYTDERVKA